MDGEPSFHAFPVDTERLATIQRYERCHGVVSAGGGRVVFESKVTKGLEARAIAGVIGISATISSSPRSKEPTAHWGPMTRVKNALTFAFLTRDKGALHLATQDFDDAPEQYGHWNYKLSVPGLNTKPAPPLTIIFCVE